MTESIDWLRARESQRHDDGTVWCEIPVLARDWLCDEYVRLQARNDKLTTVLDALLEAQFDADRSLDIMRGAARAVLSEGTT